jgi:hypothetical protein
MSRKRLIGAGLFALFIGARTVDAQDSRQPAPSAPPPAPRSVPISEALRPPPDPGPAEASTGL